ncbi:glycosyltransferase family 2 protein [Sclerotinia borealis F-4128]|uniref:Glycosyltransferase family 2 protein n=1 Tax=Sclerotinia borealis (strain F-4128) TaxID=1432307 RepID=W9CL05_SCLBF|nr:glycosyltransferase family 2 protein [Sclerotinia borealis F-4128]
MSNSTLKFGFQEAPHILREGAAILNKAKEAEQNLQEEISNFLLQTLAAIHNFIGWAFWMIPWTIISLFKTSVVLLSSIPWAILSFLIAPFHLVSSIPKYIQLLFRFTLNQALASIGSIALAVWDFFSLMVLRTSKFGRGIEALRSFFFSPPIFSIILIILSTLEPVRDLFSTLGNFFYSSPWSAAFVFLFVFKFLKTFVHLFSYNFLSAYKVPTLHPSVLPSDVTVIIPSVGDFGEEFTETVLSILDNNPAKIIISTVGTHKLIQSRRVIEGILRIQRLPGRKIEVVAIHQPNKRAQCVHASLTVATDIIAYADDHVFWPPTFLRSVLAEFEDFNVGIVGTCKRVIRQPGDNWSDSIRNFLACLYLDRHNYEMTSTYNLDGGVWVISERTNLIRTDIVQSLEYRQKYLSETFLGAGPVNCDDDNFTTRYMVNHGWKTVFHNRPEAMIRTTLGTTGGWLKFSQQLIRWAPSIWRSHSKSLFVDGRCWKDYPWTSYSMFFSNLINISIIYDPLLFLTLFNSEFYTDDNHAGAYLFWALFLSRLVKPWPYYMRHKTEMWWAVPVEFLFGYIHGAFRLLALLTCRDISSAGRDLAANMAAVR